MLGVLPLGSRPSSRSHGRWPSFDLSSWSTLVSLDFVIAARWAASLLAASVEEVWAAGQRLGSVVQSGMAAQPSLLGVLPA